MPTFGPDHTNIDISWGVGIYSVGLEWGMLQSLAFEITQVKVSIRGGHFSEYSFH